VIPGHLRQAAARTVLVGLGASDAATPPRHGQLWRAANRRRVRFQELPAGSCPFTHVAVDCAALARFRRTESAVLARAVRARR
jgi:hypothetical protein